ncbi:MAG: Ldh family oxidoreductase [Candidatus Heimdallarchaeota archaeon]|nr:Ldh family oxidoreductase [Candidatus Heimdallarchaeota archaeon]
MKNDVTIALDELYNFMKEVFIGLGYPEEQAKISAEILIEADLRGITSHGVQRLKYYFVRVKAEQHLVADYEILKDEAATAVIDGNHGNGHFISYKAMEMAIEKAKKYGIGMVVVRNSTHYGIAGYYPLMAIKKGCLGITGTNARPAVAPTFGGEPMLGTNPLTFGFPTDEEFPFVLDCATSIIQRGKVELAARDGTPLQEGVVIDRETGNSRTDAAQLLKDFVENKAALLALGGAGEELSGHKGYGYSAVVEILSAALQNGVFLKDLSGLDEDGNKAHFRVGHFFIAIDPSFFLGLETFKKVAGNICRGLRNSDKLPDAIRIYTAGEKEFDAEKKVRENGVPLSKSIQEDLIFMRDELNLTTYKFGFE